MQIICLTQAYNESTLMHKYMQWLYPLVDKWVITEGSLTPFGNLSIRSIDNTVRIINDFISMYDKKNKIIFKNAIEPKIKPNNREVYEGLNKQRMLDLAEPEHGDLIVIGDADEFWQKDRFMNIVDKFRKNDKINHVPIEEWQFAYNLRTAFKAEHNGRFFRYINGAKFTTTNHFVYPDGQDITRNYEYLATRDETNMIHLCWTKHPELIRNKVLSFNRASFTQWYNNVYLVYPDSPELAYQNNKRIAPYFGTGFAEGQHERLQEFTGTLPSVLTGMFKCWLSYIRKNKGFLKI